MTPKEQLTQSIFDVLKEGEWLRVGEIGKRMGILCGTKDYYSLNNRLTELSKNNILRVDFVDCTRNFYSRVEGW